MRSIQKRQQNATLRG